MSKNLKVPYIQVENFICKKCYHNEYAVVDVENVTIICDKCGELYKGKYEKEIISVTIED